MMHAAATSPLTNAPRPEASAGRWRTEDALAKASYLSSATMRGLLEPRDYFLYEYASNGVAWTCAFHRAPGEQHYVRFGEICFQPAPSIDQESGLSHGKRGHLPPVTTSTSDGVLLVGDTYAPDSVNIFQVLLL
jgi:hypothetical protein